MRIPEPHPLPDGVPRVQKTPKRHPNCEILLEEAKKEGNKHKERSKKKEPKRGCQKTDIKKAVKSEIAQAFTSNDRDSTDGIYLHNLRLVFFLKCYIVSPPLPKQ